MGRIPPLPVGTAGPSVPLRRGTGRAITWGLSVPGVGTGGLGTRQGSAASARRWRDTGGASAALNYLASMFINQQFLCKQTHPEPLLPVTLATAQSRPWLGMCSGLPPGPQPCLRLFACSLFLPQGVFRFLDLLSIGSSPSLNPGPPYCGIIDLPIIVSWTFGLLDPGSPHH